eukprot:6445789-Heterocapsa_arctica.AAC.1
MAFIGKELARHVHDPMVSDMKALKHLLRYIQHTRDYVMHFSRTRNMTDDILEVVTDAGWRGGEHGRSTSGA